jgi:hypothetical protein
MYYAVLQKRPVPLGDCDNDDARRGKRSVSNPRIGPAMLAPLTCPTEPASP